jgi:fumarylacetoacetate (FAA) hydrolase family protein
VSATPPGGNGTIIVIGFSGQAGACAQVGAVRPHRAASRHARRVKWWLIESSPEGLARRSDTAVLDPADAVDLDPYHVAAANAMDHVFGYTIVNDISARDLQIKKHQQFFKGKSLDRSCPMGPWLVTADEIDDPKTLGLRLRLNGETRQDSSVGDLIFDIPTIIAPLSLGQTLEAGQVISTGTPSGVGMGRTPPQYMQAGDVMEAEVDRIGVLRNRVVAAE